MMMFGYLILISVDFYDLISPFFPPFSFRLRNIFKNKTVIEHISNRLKVRQKYYAKRRSFNSLLYQTRKTVFHRDIQTPRRELKLLRVAKFF